MQPLTIHLIPNAHLDPVWLWDWREGLNTAWQTCRTVLDLMDEFPELTFIRGESAVYQHIEQHDPVTFRRIARMIRAGRWDIVGGTVIQPDTNLPATETFLRQFSRGQSYFLAKFRQRVRVAWAADSFGHSAGLPNILVAAGIENIAFTRTGNVRPPEPAFWWESPTGARVLAYRPPVGWYGCERDELPRRFDEVLAAAAQSRLRHIGLFFGLGNHGGGPTRRHLLDVRAWTRAHPEVRVVYSGLHRLFDAIRAEQTDLPVHRGELNFCLRGCYASAAKLKFAYRKAEALVNRAERLVALTGAKSDLTAATDAVLFNSFHDILPGSSIERALDDQLAQLGGALHLAQRAELRALNALAARVDTTVPRVTGDHPAATPFLVWNPHPHEFTGHVELEACLDARPLFGYRGRPREVPIEVRGPTGKPVAFQEIAHEHLFFPTDPWRKRVVVPVTLPPLGWAVYSLGWVEGAPRPATDTLAAVVQITGDEVVLWDRVRLRAITVEDPGGAWGDFDEKAVNLQQLRHRWQISRVEELETGPERRTWWVRWLAGHSRMEWFIRQYRGRDAVEFDARVLWNETGARLKLVCSDFGDTAEYDVPGGTVTRGELGEVPGGRWVRGRYGFASDALYNFNLYAGTLQATVCRATKYAWGGSDDVLKEPWHPAVDAGELKFRFRLAPDTTHLARLARELEMPPLVQIVPAKPGAWPRRGTLGAANVTLLALRGEGRHLFIRVQNETSQRRTARFRGVTLGALRPGEIATYRLTGKKAARVGGSAL